MSINEIFSKVMTEEQKRSELVKRTPFVVVRSSVYGKKDYRYYYTRLGDVRVFEFEHGEKHLDGPGGGQRFRVGLVRLSTPELDQAVAQIDADIKVLQDKRRELLKEKFLWLHPVRFEEILKVTRGIHEAVHSR